MVFKYCKNHLLNFNTTLQHSVSLQFLFSSRCGRGTIKNELVSVHYIHEVFAHLYFTDFLYLLHAKIKTPLDRSRQHVRLGMTLNRRRPVVLRRITFPSLPTLR